MKKILLTSLLTLLFATPVFANPNIVVSYPYIEDIVSQIGKDKVTVSALAKGEWDPHVVIPKPSLIAKARKADLIITNGAELEIGWLPPIIKQANNPNIQIGSKNYLELASFIKLIDKPSNISRAGGDVHPDGNPHFILNPDNVLIISKVIYDKLVQTDPQNKDFYKQNYSVFIKKWNEKLAVWNKKLKPLSGKKVIQYHKLYNYLLKKYNIVDVNTVEPLPGIPPTTKHLEELISQISKENIKMILQDVYHSQNASKLLAQKTGISIVVLPHDVSAIPEAKDIFSLFDEITTRLTK